MQPLPGGAAYGIALLGDRMHTLIPANAPLPASAKQVGILATQQQCWHVVGGGRAEVRALYLHNTEHGIITLMGAELLQHMHATSIAGHACNMRLPSKKP